MIWPDYDLTKTQPWLDHDRFRNSGVWVQDISDPMQDFVQKPFLWTFSNDCTCEAILLKFWFQKVNLIWASFLSGMSRLCIFLAKLWSWQTHLSTHHNHVTPLMHLMHLMHLLARFPQHRARCANKNYWFCSCGHFLASSGNYRKDGHYKSFLTETSKKFPLWKWYRGKSNLSFYSVAVLVNFLPIEK